MWVKRDRKDSLILRGIFSGSTSPLLFKLLIYLISSLDMAGSRMASDSNIYLTPSIWVCWHCFWSECILFVWQGFGSKGATGVDSVRSSHKLPSCLTESMLASSKADVPLAKAMPIRMSGSASGTAHWRGRRKNCATATGKRSENM